MKNIILVIALIASPSVAFADWSGFDYDSGTFVDITSGSLVRSGNDIEIFDYGSGYKDVQVESIYRYGSSVEVEVYDYSTGQYRTLTMD